MFFKAGLLSSSIKAVARWQDTGEISYKEKL